MPTFGPFSVVAGEVHTGVVVSPGDGVSILAMGSVDFGWGVVLGPDGDSWTTPSDYPAPTLRKNSLIYRYGNGNTWYQGGTARAPVVPFGESGGIVLRTNDKNVADNTGGWSVTITHSPLPPPTTAPNAPYLTISSMEVVQVVQTPTNQVPLIAGKPTVVRVFVDSGVRSGLDVGPGPNMWPDVTGYMTVADSRGFVIGVGGLLNPAKVINARPPVAIDRNNPDHSLNFEIPTGLLAPGRYILTATVYVLGKSGQGAGWMTSQVHIADFLERPAIQQFQPLLIGSPSRGIATPAFSTWFSDFLEGVLPVMPFAMPRVQINSSIALSTDRDLDSWLGLNLLVMDLATMVILSTGAVGGPRCGILPPSPTREYSGMGAPRILVSVPAFVYSAGASSTFAHELSHAFGFGHSPGCGAPAPIDTRLPSNGRTDVTGWNTETDSIVPSGSPDMMSYCGPAEWPSLNLYSTIFDEAPI